MEIHLIPDKKIIKIVNRCFQAENPVTFSQNLVKKPVFQDRFIKTANP